MFNQIVQKYKNLKIQNLITIGCDPSKESFNLTLMYLNPRDTLTIMYKQRVKIFCQRGKKFVKVDLRDSIQSAQNILYTVNMEDASNPLNYKRLSSHLASQLLSPFFNIDAIQHNPIEHLLYDLLSDIDPLIWNRLAKTNKWFNQNKSINLVECNQKYQIDINIDVMKV